MKCKQCGEEIFAYHVGEFCLNSGDGKHEPAEPVAALAVEPQECTGFEVQIKFHTAAIKNVSLEDVRFAVGAGMDSAGYQEEIDYTLEVRRVYK